jgi:GNAT superfamily N-acetyltransferase
MENFSIQQVKSVNLALQSISKLYSDVQQELRPDLPPSPVEEQSTYLQNLSKYRAALRWIAINQKDEVIGCSYLGFKLTPENPTAARVDVLVSKAYRRNKIGTALLIPLMKEAYTAGRINLTCTAKDNSSGDRFLSSIGLQCKGYSIESHLDIEVAKDNFYIEILNRLQKLQELYDFFWWENNCPDHLISDLANAKMWLNSSPRGNRRQEIWSISSDWLREEEAIRRNSGITWWTIIAIERATAKVVGFTDALFSSYRPSIVQQQDTAIDPLHRRRGLALYLKTKIILKIRNELRQARILTTINGCNNSSILHLNQQLGFVSKYKFGKWEGDLDRLTLPLNSVSL